MIDHLKSMAVFAIVVEEKSFRRAALRLSLSPSVISHHITKLEKNLGVALIYRSTRSFSLTDEGQLFYQSAKAMLVAATDGMGELAADSQNVLTQLRVAIPEMLSSSRVFDRVTAFSLQNPGIQLMITSSDTTTDLIRETLDVAIRVGRLKDSELKARKIDEDDLIVVAAPDLIKKYSEPTHPNDLLDWKRISFTPVPDDIEFRKNKVKILPVWQTVSAVTDSVHVMHKMALAGVGLAGLPKEAVRDDIDSGKLRQILPGWSAGKLDFYVVWHKNTSARSITRSFIKHMSAGT